MVMMAALQEVVGVFHSGPWRCHGGMRQAWCGVAWRGGENSTGVHGHIAQVLWVEAHALLHCY